MFDALKASALDCTGCRLATCGRTQVVFGGGPVPADVMAVGEAPGFGEDESGVAFCADAGEVLDTHLPVAGLTRAEVYVTNTAKCHPPNNREPYLDEAKACVERWLVQEVALVQPKAILALGTVASQALTGLKISGARRQVHTFMGIPVVATRHPASTLYHGGELAKRQFRNDLVALKRLLSGAEAPYWKGEEAKRVKGRG